MSNTIPVDETTTANVRTGRPVLRIVAWVLIGGLAACLLASISAGATGLQVGSAARYLGQPSRALAVPIAPLADGSTEPLPGTTITVWFLDGPYYFSADTIFAADFSRGLTRNGDLAYHIQFDEAGFNQYMMYWFYPSEDELLANVINGLRNPHIDLIPGGLILNGEIDLGGQWTPVGLFYELDEDGKQLTFRGVQLEDQAVTTLPDSFLDKNVGGTIEELANHALSDLTFIDDQTGAQLAIHQIYIDDDRAEVLVLAKPGDNGQ